MKKAIWILTLFSLIFLWPARDLYSEDASQGLAGAVTESTDFPYKHLGNACVAYYMKEGTWPRSAAAFFAFASENDFEIDPGRFKSLSFIPRPEGTLKVEYVYLAGEDENEMPRWPGRRSRILRKSKDSKDAKFSETKGSITLNPPSK